MNETRPYTVNGLTIHAATWGDRAGPAGAVLLVHGLTASGQYWAEVGPALAARGWFVVAPDLRGRGRSGKPAHGYGIPYHADDLLALCDALGLPSVQFVGHSLGALIGLFVAAIHPERVGKLALIDAGGVLPADTMQAIGASVARLGSAYPSLDGYLAAMRAVPLFPWSPFWEEYYRYDAEVRPDGTVASRVPRAAVVEEGAVNAVIDLAALPAHVKAPTLIVRATVGMLGPDRGLLLPQDEAERLLRTIPGSRLVEPPGTNHYTVALVEHLTTPLLAFLGGQP